MPKYEKNLLRTDKQTPTILIEAIFDMESQSCSENVFVRKYSQMEDRLLKRKDQAQNEMAFIHMYMDLKLTDIV